MEIKKEIKPVEVIKTDAKINVNSALFTEIERNPSDWNIIAEGDTITATNTKTAKVFTGTVSEFSGALRGQ
jgi:hypothetical protein